ncbi:hypothetical protein ACFQ1S_40965, partial [Kibdelosporangium lantanae]
GYFGVAGVDALVDTAGGIYPVIEINARNNMSTYQVQLQERFVGPEKIAVAKHYPIRLAEPTGFDTVRERLDGLVFDGDTGLLVNNFATVNAAATPDQPFDGRLYGIVVATSPEQLTAIDDQVTARIAGMRNGKS